MKSYVYTLFNSLTSRQFVVDVSRSWEVSLKIVLEVWNT